MLSRKVTKSFKNDFYMILNLLKSKTPFAFNRFSDGELYILQNKELVLGKDLIKIGSLQYTGPYQKEDHKHFDPSLHSFYRQKLVDAYVFDAPMYFKGLSCKCCIGKSDFEWQFTILSNTTDNLTWANLLVNGNYPSFIGEMFPLFSVYPLVVVCNEKADLGLMHNIRKEYRVGYNAMINDYSKIDEIKTWIKDFNIRGHLFLFSASTFSKIAIHQLYEKFPENTYIDIGTTLNGFWNMSVERQYLKDYWFEVPYPSDIYKNCIW